MNWITYGMRCYGLMARLRKTMRNTLDGLYPSEGESLAPLERKFEVL
jgi:hypothetical protein